MAGEWAQVPIGSISTIFDGPHATPPTQDQGAVFLGIDALAEGRLDLDNVRHVSDETFNLWTRRVTPQAGDLVFSYETRLGQGALIPEGLKCCLGRRLALARPDQTKVNPRYLLYYFLGPDFQEVIRAHTKPGSTVDRIHLRDFPAFPVKLPPMSEQVQIANLLGVLDDKIELNRRMSETSEAVARALYESWFVEFDPVRAKSQGRPTGLPDAVAAHFPERIGANGLPESWRVEPLLDHAQLISGGTPNTQEPAYWDGSIPWASARDVSQCGGRFLVKSGRAISELGLSESATRLIPKLSTVVVARGATTGRHCILGAEMAMNQTCYALHSTEDLPFWLSCAFSEVVEHLVSAGHGSIFNTITTSTIAGAEAVIGGSEVMRAFEAAVLPEFNRILSMTEESASLATLRDALLPRLVSGELPIRDAEAAVAVA